VRSECDASKRGRAGKEHHEMDVFRRRDWAKHHDTVGRWTAPRPLPVRIWIDTVPTVVLRSTLAHCGSLRHLLIMTGLH
jgi:hypothetical protein